MKTAQIMNRKVLGVSFTQNHKSEMVNLTEFANELTAEVDQGRVKLISDSTLQHYEILANSKPAKMAGLEFNKNFKDLDRYLKKKTVIKLQAALMNDVDSIKDLVLIKRGKYGGTWVHPLIFVDYLMWISPDFHAAGLKLIYDNVLKYRDAGGDSFKRVNAALLDNGYITTGREYADLARAVAQKCEVPTMIEVSSSGKQKIKYDWNAANEEVLDARTKINNQLEGIINLRFLEDVSSIIASLSKL